MITIRLSIPVEHATSPHERVIAALDLLMLAVEMSMPETPTLGGILRDGHGRLMGSYVVEWNSTVGGNR